jgi:uncharacterized cupredoxin-like copper-binding protein
VLIAGLSTGHKIGLGLVGLAFILFALSSSFLIPRYRRDFPGPTGVGGFVAITVLFFCAMMSAVWFFAKEPKEHTAEAATPPAATTTTAQAATTTTAQAATTTTQAAPPPKPATTKVAVTEKEFSIKLASPVAKAGAYELDVTNAGRLGHNLVVKGPGVNDQGIPGIGPGSSATLKVTLGKGTYELYCSVPGHKQAGMDLKITVG